MSEQDNIEAADDLSESDAVEAADLMAEKPSTPDSTTVSISASSSFNGIPVWTYRAQATVKNTSSGSTRIPQGRVTFHFSDRAVVNRDESSNLDSNGSCAVEFTDTFIYYVVNAVYQPTVDFSGSTSDTVSTGR